MGERSYDDEQLTRAVAASRSWRSVLRALGLAATSSAAIRSVKRHAERLSLDTSHFTGQRRWTDAQLGDAVAASRSWMEVADLLGLSGGSSTTIMKGHAVRLGIDTSHFGRGSHANSLATAVVQPDRLHLPRAGAMLAAAWFTLCGHDVSWPLEPCRYDLLVRRDDRFSRVQVKTTRMRGQGSWVVRLHSGGRQRGPYDPDDIDEFFVVDGDLEYYLIPVAAVGGMHAITVSGYAQYKLVRQMREPN